MTFQILIFRVYRHHVLILRHEVGPVLWQLDLLYLLLAGCGAPAYQVRDESARPAADDYPDKTRVFNQRHQLHIVVREAFESFPRADIQAGIGGSLHTRRRHQLVRDDVFLDFFLAVSFAREVFSVRRCQDDVVPHAARHVVHDRVKNTLCVRAVRPVLVIRLREGKGYCAFLFLIAVFHVQRLPGAFLLVFRDDGRILQRVAHDAHVLDALTHPADVLDDEPHRPADGRVGDVARAESAGAVVDVDFIADRPADNPERRPRARAESESGIAQETLLRFQQVYRAGD